MNTFRAHPWAKGVNFFKGCAPHSLPPCLAPPPLHSTLAAFKNASLMPPSLLSSVRGPICACRRYVTNWCLMTAPRHLFFRAALESFTKLVKVRACPVY
jgi:hypothetical protein